MRSLIFAALCLFLDCSAFAQEKAHVIVVPPAVEQKFLVENPEATAIWKKDGPLYKALFINPLNNLGYILVYDENGRVVRREKELERPEYPAPIIAYHEKHFPGEGLAVYSSTDSSGNLLFYSRKNNTVFWFDTNGNPLRSAADSVESKVTR